MQRSQLVVIITTTRDVWQAIRSLASGHNELVPVLKEGACPGIYQEEHQQVAARTQAGNLHGEVQVEHHRVEHTGTLTAVLFSRRRPTDERYQRPGKREQEGVLQYEVNVEGVRKGASRHPQQQTLDEDQE